MVEQNRSRGRALPTWVDAIKHLTFVYEPCKVPLVTRNPRHSSSYSIEISLPV